MTASARSLLALFVPCVLQGALSVTLSSSPASPTRIGTIVTWSANAIGNDEDTFWYRFRFRRVGGDFHTIRDYGLSPSLEWSAISNEGRYEVEVSVRDTATGESASSIEPYELTPIARDEPSIVSTVHPLVFLYAAPACEPGNTIYIEFRSPEGDTQNTPARECLPGITNNFYLAGLRAETLYTASHVIRNSRETWRAPELPFTTGPSAADLANYQVLVPPRDPRSMGILMQSPLNKPTVATDLFGRVVWYSAGDVRTLTTPARGGGFWGITLLPAEGTVSQYIRKSDLLGLTIAETNAARINEQLTAFGKNPITSFHHEVRELADGRVLVLGNVERMIDNGADPSVTLGDAILVLDSDLQLVWSWDAFDFLDPQRRATLDETCTPSGGGCPSFFLSPEANDWLHGNSLHLTPDGNILYSSRHQDWLLKIDYRNGEGTGEILWKLGNEGDFWMDSTDSAPWFSHQHDASLLAGDVVLLFDNGNLRRAADSSARSRGQVLTLNEGNRTASIVHSFDLGTYSPALGSAQLLPNGNFHFLSGYVDGTSAEAVEFDPTGAVAYRIRANTQLYRAFRMPDIYTPPE